MIFKFFDTIRTDLEIDLEVLTKDTNLYTSLLLQHQGIFHITESRFGNLNDQTDLFTKFIALARNQNVSLAATPEYSCPWTVIQSILSNAADWPASQKLWALGCESITPDELISLKEKHAGTNVIVHFDESALKNGGGLLLDPLCYVFNAKSKTNNSAYLVLLIQFKTQHMGVWQDDVEQERYIPGKEIYVLRNSPASINFFTIICSEAAIFQISDTFRAQLDDRWDENPYIILNIQMNPKPSYSFFKDFRASIMKAVHKDIITLNWAGGSTFSNGRPILFYSKSNFLLKSQKIDYDSENWFLDNHQRGMYYTYKMHDDHCFFLNSKPCAFLVANQKPSAGPVPGALFRKTGPEMKDNFLWNESKANFEQAVQMDDDFVAFLNGIGCTNTIFHDLLVNPIDKERLANISLGMLKIKAPGEPWHSIQKLVTFFLDDDEIINRLTFLHDEGGTPNRQSYIEAIDFINTQILSNASSFPDTFSVFRSNCTEVRFFRSGDYDYRYNLVTNDNNHKATVCYAGRVDLAAAEKVFKQMKNIFIKDDQSRKRVIVWYKNGPATIVPITDDDKPKATDDNSGNPGSISTL